MADHRVNSTGHNMLIDPHWADYAVIRQYKPGQYVFKEGDRGDELYIIVEGLVAIIKGAHTLTPLVLNYRGKDELLGEVSLLTDETRSASVMAIEPTTLLCVAHQDFWFLFDERPSFREMIVKTVIERLLAADESRMHAAAVERALFDRLSSLANENERMAEVVHLRQETMRFIVHDLRNPLNLVMMALNLIETDPAYAEEAESRRFVAMAAGGVKRMYALVESLLDVERLESGGAALMLGTVNVCQLVDEVVEQYRPLAESTRNPITVRHLSDDMPPITADRDRLARVITNLIDNGLKFSPTGMPLRISTWCDGDGWVWLSVVDRGPGIPAEFRRRIFDRFTQVNSYRDASRGFGLGLAYCRTAITAHGGRIWVEEGDEGVGSRFVFTLPVEPPEPSV